MLTCDVLFEMYVNDFLHLKTWPVLFLFLSSSPMFGWQMLPDFYPHCYARWKWCIIICWKKAEAWPKQSDIFVSMMPTFVYDRPKWISQNIEPSIVTIAPELRTQKAQVLLPPVIPTNVMPVNTFWHSFSSWLDSHELVQQSLFWCCFQQSWSRNLPNQHVATVVIFYDRGSDSLDGGLERRKEIWIECFGKMRRGENELIPSILKWKRDAFMHTPN